jgi:hypothetical protein
MKMKTTIVLHDVYCDVTYPEYLHVRNRYYKNSTSFKCFKIIVFQHLYLADENNNILTEWKWFETTVLEIHKKQRVFTFWFHNKNFNLYVPF